MKFFLIIAAVVLSVFSSTAFSSGSCNPYSCYERDPCVDSRCERGYDGEWHCIKKPKHCVAHSPHEEAYCDTTDGKCKTKSKQCHSKDPCVMDSHTDYHGNCVHSCGECDPHDRHDKQCMRSKCCRGRWQYEEIEGCDKECAKEVNITVVEAHKCDIDRIHDHHSYGHCHDKKNCGDLTRYRFKFGSSKAPYATKQTHVISFDPYVACGLRNRGSCDNFVSTTSPTPPFCDLFDFQPTNTPLWDVTINSPKVRYSADFSLGELIHCKDYNGIGGLVTVSPSPQDGNDTLIYSGSMYSTTVAPKNCANERDCEKILFKVACPFEIRYKTDGMSQVSFKTMPLEWTGHWVGNCFDERGDLFVTLETCIQQPTDGPDIVQLGMPMVDSVHETGPAMHFVNGTRCVSHPGIGMECCQRWWFRTVGQGQTEEIHGAKPIVFHVFFGPEKKFQVRLNMDLWVKRPVGVETIRDKIGAELMLYSGPDFETKSDKFVDCSCACGELCLDNRDFKPTVRKVVLCFSKHDDLLPFDPYNPDTTGCGTQNVYIKKKTLYDSSMGGNTAHNFSIVSDPPFESFKAGFCWNVKGHSKFRQVLKVWWGSEMTPYESLQGGFNDDNYGYGNQEYGKPNYDVNHYSFYGTCPHNTLYSDGAGHCVVPAMHSVHHNGTSIIWFGVGIVVFFLIIGGIIWCAFGPSWGSYRFVDIASRQKNN